MCAALSCINDYMWCAAECLVIQPRSSRRYRADPFLPLDTHPQVNGAMHDGNGQSLLLCVRNVASACTSRGASKATDVLSAYQTMSYKPYHACLFRAWDTEVSRPLYDNRVIAVSGSVFCVLNNNKLIDCSCCIVL